MRQSLEEDRHSIRCMSFVAHKMTAHCRSGRLRDALNVYWDPANLVSERGREPGLVLGRRISEFCAEALGLRWTVSSSVICLRRICRPRPLAWSPGRNKLTATSARQSSNTTIRNVTRYHWAREFHDARIAVARSRHYAPRTMTGSGPGRLPSARMPQAASPSE